MTYPQGVVASYDYDFMDRQTTLKVNPGTGSVNLVTAATCECGPKKINGVGFGDDPPPPPGVEPPAGLASVPSTPSIPFTTYDRCRCSSNDKVYVNVQTRRSLIPSQFFNNVGKVNLDYDCLREKK